MKDTKLVVILSEDGCFENIKRAFSTRRKQPLQKASLLHYYLTISVTSSSLHVNIKYSAVDARELQTEDIVVYFFFQNRKLIVICEDRVQDVCETRGDPIRISLLPIAMLIESSSVS